MFYDINLTPNHQPALDNQENVGLTLQWCVINWLDETGTQEIEIPEPTLQNNIAHIDLSNIRDKIDERLRQDIQDSNDVNTIGGFPAFVIACGVSLYQGRYNKSEVIGGVASFNQLSFSTNNGKQSFEEYFNDLSQQINNQYNALRGQYFVYPKPQNQQQNVTHSISNLIQNLSREDRLVLQVHQEGDYRIAIEMDVFYIKNDAILSDGNLTIRPLDARIYVGNLGFTKGSKECSIECSCFKIEGYQDRNCVATGWRVQGRTDLSRQRQKTIDLTFDQVAINGDDHSFDLEFFKDLIIRVNSYLISYHRTLLLDMGSSASVIASSTRRIINGEDEPPTFQFTKINPHTDDNQLIPTHQPKKEPDPPTNQTISTDEFSNHQDTDTHTKVIKEADNRGEQQAWDKVTNAIATPDDDTQINQTGDDNYAIESAQDISPALFGLEVNQDKTTVTHLHNRKLYRRFLGPQTEQRSLIQNIKNYLRYPQFREMYSIAHTAEDYQITTIQTQLAGNDDSLLRACYASQLGLTEPHTYETLPEKANLIKPQEDEQEANKYQKVLLALPNILRHQDDAGWNGSATIFSTLLSNNDLLATLPNNYPPARSNITFVPEAYAVLFKHLNNQGGIECEDYIIFDIGAGTADIAFARIKRGDAHFQRLFIASQASSHKAGNYIDYMLAHYFHRYLIEVLECKEEYVKQYNPDIFVEYCLGICDDFSVAPLTKTYIEYIKRGEAGSEFASYGEYNAEFQTFYNEFLAYSTQQNTNEDARPTPAQNIFIQFQEEINEMINGYIDAVQGIGIQHMENTEFKMESIPTKLIVSGRASLWQPIQHLLKLRNNDNCEVILNTGQEKQQVCRGLAASLRWEYARDLAQVKGINRANYFYNDDSSYHYPPVYIIALGIRPGDDDLANEPIWIYRYNITDANNELRKYVYHRIVVYSGICLLKNSNNQQSLEDFVKAYNDPQYTKPNFNLKAIGDLMDKYNILQMCQATFTMNGEGGFSLIEDKARGFSVKLCHTTSNTEAIIFPYVQGQRLNNRNITTCEILPTSFYQANWPNPIVVQRENQ